MASYDGVTADAAMSGIREQILDNVKAVTGHDELKIVVAAHKHVNTQYQAKVVKDDIESHFAIGSKGQNVIDALRRLLVVTCEAVGKEIENAEHRRRFEY